ncbi:MAG: hypothetical protein GY700_06575 [Propionibacteriaceae bacterium]|nr:hypothetical protein [Propionibacteriaceae bacterium]
MDGVEVLENLCRALSVFEPYRDLVYIAWREHYTCEDYYYSCAASGQGFVTPGPCSCGADEANHDLLVQLARSLWQRQVGRWVWNSEKGREAMTDCPRCGWPEDRKCEGCGSWDEHYYDSMSCGFGVCEYIETSSNCEGIPGKAEILCRGARDDDPLVLTGPDFYCKHWRAR